MGRAIGIAIVAGVIVGGAIVALRPPSGQQLVAGVTDAPATPFVPVVFPTVSATPETASPSVPASTASPAATAGTGVATPRPAPTSTPRPTPRPTRTPAPPPTPTPAPTQTSNPFCTVIDLVGVNTSNAQLAWNTAGFSGTVFFETPIPPQYKIGWQSLPVGTSVLCITGISVRQTAP